MSELNELLDVPDEYFQSCLLLELPRQFKKKKVLKLRLHQRQTKPEYLGVGPRPQCF